MSGFKHRRLFAAAVFVASTLVLAIQLITPTPVMVTVGEGTTDVAELGGYFQYRDVAVITVAACLLGASGTYLLTPTDNQQSADGPDSRSESAARSNLDPSDELLEARRQEWEETAERLSNNECTVYRTVLEADGVLPQSDIVDRTDISKATISRTLDSLETKNLVERKRRGMGNVVLLR